MNHLAKLSLISLTSLAACTTTSQDTGLTIDVQDADRIAGTFASDGVAVAFDFSRRGDHHVMAFHARDGRPLTTTTLDGAFQTTDVLGGRLVASGITGAPDPTIVGDRAAMQELSGRPEAALIEGLHDALVAAGVDEDLYQPKPPEVSSVYNWDGRYFLFQPGDQRDWLSAAGASPTWVYAKNPWPTNGACAAVVLTPQNWGPRDSVIAPPWSDSYKAVYYWGAIVTVSTPWSATPWFGCQPAQTLIRVSPYAWSP